MGVYVKLFPVLILLKLLKQLFHHIEKSHIPLMASPLECFQVYLQGILTITIFCLSSGNSVFPLSVGGVMSAILFVDIL